MLDPDLQQRVNEGLAEDVGLAREAAMRYDRGTKPLRILAYIAVFTAIGTAIILAVPIEDGKETWLTVLYVGMAYVCLRMLPSWRKRLPKLHEAVERLEENVRDAATADDPVPHWKDALANRLIIAIILKQARYKTPFPDATNALLDHTLGEIEDAGATGDGAPSA